jgi:GNAT superfamily N-acetyltransferase
VLRIRQVQTKKDLSDFIRFPWKIYKGDPFWVPPLISERKDFFNPQKNPFFKHSEVLFYLAEKDNETVGRICGILNRNHIDFHKEKAGFFGFFECVNDFEVAKLLLEKVKEWLKSSGMEIMRGPMNFSTNDEVGFLLEGFDSPPVFMMTYNPPYYLDFMEKYGMVKAKDLYAYYLDKTCKPPDRMVRMAERIENKEKTIVRCIELKNFEAEVQKIKKIYNSAWSKNWGFVPMTDEEFEHLARNMKMIIDPYMVFIAEVDGEPAGFSLALPDLNLVLKRLNGRLFPFGLPKLLWYTKVKRIIDGVRILTMGVIPEYQKRGIDNIFYMRTINDGIRRGYRWGELSWVLEDNYLMNRVLKLIGARLYKKYRIYEMGI